MNDHHFDMWHGEDMNGDAFCTEMGSSTPSDYMFPQWRVSLPYTPTNRDARGHEKTTTGPQPGFSSNKFNTMFIDIGCGQNPITISGTSSLLFTGSSPPDDVEVSVAINVDCDCN